MHWVPDSTGRFPLRPHYDPKYLDFECEKIVQDFLLAKYRKCEYPISTDDLQVMIERDVSSLDVYADLSNEGPDVEGLTNFFLDKAPEVLISANLSTEEYKQNRFRTTLTHEYGHVKFHTFLWTKKQGRLPLLGAEPKGPRCKRESIMGASKTDWMEWQAGYACGAMLMPATPTKQLVQAAFREWGVHGGISPESAYFDELLRRVSVGFSVSKDAAKVRLHKLHFVTTAAETPAMTLPF